LIIEPKDKDGTVRVRERLFRSASAPTPGSNAPPPHYDYEGVVVSMSPLSLVVMRSKLTRLPRIHWITGGPQAPCYSHCVEAVFHTASSDAIAATMLRLEPQTGGA
jgi:hypothetical protein